MTTNTSDGADITPDLYLAQLKELGLDPVNNLGFSQRLDGGKGISNIAPMHPATYYDVYPDGGGVTGALVANLKNVPTPSLDFKFSANNPTLDPKDPNPKFKA
ncbi:MAG: hypothetical protein WBK77_10595 [Alphaproteobacteria bacterium]